MSRKISNWTSTGAALAAWLGMAAIVHGAALAWRPAGWMLGGFFVAAPAVCVAYAAVRESK